MHFIIISKKEGFDENSINDKYLKQIKAPSLIAETTEKIKINNFIVYIYNYSQILEETENYSYYFDENNLYLINGIVNEDNALRKHDIGYFFESLKKYSILTGDYQLISIDKEGNGFLKTPQFSLKQLFFYEDEKCKVLSSEIKLIIDGIKNLNKNKFVDNFDLNYIKELMDIGGELKTFNRHTAFEKIRRIYPHDEKKFKSGTIVIKKNKSLKIPEEVENKFNKDKAYLYDNYYKEVSEFV